MAVSNKTQYDFITWNANHKPFKADQTRLAALTIWLTAFTTSLSRSQPTAIAIYGK